MDAYVSAFLLPHLVSSWPHFGQNCSTIYNTSSSHWKLPSLNPFSPTLFLTVANTSLPKHSPRECPNVKKNKKGGLDQYGPECFGVWPFDTTGLESVNVLWWQNTPKVILYHIWRRCDRHLTFWCQKLIRSPLMADGHINRTRKCWHA